MPETGCGEVKELIFFAILFRLHIFCDFIHDAIDKHVYVWRISLIGQSDSFQLLKWRTDLVNNILV